MGTGTVVTRLTKATGVVRCLCHMYSTARFVSVSVAYDSLEGRAVQLTVSLMEKGGVGACFIPTRMTQTCTEHPHPWMIDLHLCILE